MSTRIRPRAFDEQVHLLCTVVRYWRGRGDAISVLSGLVTTPSRFQWEERVVYVRCAIARRVKMHNACLRNCQRYSEHPRAASRYTSSRFTRHAITLLCVIRAFTNCTSGGQMMNRGMSSRFDKDLGIGREWPAKCFPRAYHFSQDDTFLSFISKVNFYNDNYRYIFVIYRYIYLNIHLLKWL